MTNMFKETLRPRGKIYIEVYDLENRIVDKIEHSNLILESGLAALCSVIADNTAMNVNYIACGNGTADPAPSDTRLVNELSRAEIIAKVSRNSNSVLFGSYFGFEKEAGIISEFGLVINGQPAGDTGTFLARSVIGNPVSKTNFNAFSITWVVTFAGDYE